MSLSESEREREQNLGLIFDCIRNMKKEQLWKDKHVDFRAPVLAANVTSNHIRCNTVVEYRTTCRFETLLPPSNPSFALNRSSLGLQPMIVVKKLNNLQCCGQLWLAMLEVYANNSVDTISCPILFFFLPHHERQFLKKLQSGRLYLKKMWKF